MKNSFLTSRVNAWLNVLPLPDPVNRRMAALLEVMLIGFISIIIIASILNLAILLSGLLLGRRALALTYFLASGVVSLGAYREQSTNLNGDGLTVALNFILLHGLMSVFLGQFGVTLRTALHAALEREHELQNEVNIRELAEAAVQQSTERLEILHEIDRSLLSARSPYEIAMGALVRIRKLIPCLHASVTLIDLDKKEAKFLAADFDDLTPIPGTPIQLEEFGLNIIDELRLNKPWSTNEILEDPQVADLSRRLADEDGIHSWLFLPLMYQGQLIGALNLGRGVGGSFTMEDSAIAHDVANQLAITIQHINLYNTLQNELIERKKLISELEANNAELERFTYTVSHDLRNPLVTIKGFLGMLEKDLQDGRKERIASDFQRIANAADKWTNYSQTCWNSRG